jgi:tetratricopeptide (TPR) repeat protein
LPELPDPRAIEGFMKGFLCETVGRPAAGTPVGKAQELMYQAFGTPDPEERVKLAKQALDLSPDCADAYVLLAEHTNSRKEALDLFEKGVAAGERALGPTAFQEDVGNFWGLVETRPYMRAREGLASKLWTMGRRDEAIEHLRDLLRLNPGDNQGVRYTLAGWLLAEGRDEELVRLLEEYDESSVFWAYTKALVAFRRHGDTPESRKLLKVARKANKHVLAYVLGREPLPQERPGYYSPGDQNEAVFYVGSTLSGWKETPGATAWLKHVEQGTRTKRSEEPKVLRPTPPVKERLLRLPQAFDVWQAGSRPLPFWIEERGERYQPWIVMVTSRTEDLILAQEMTGVPPSPALIWDTLVAAMESPAMGTPHRPVELNVLGDEYWDELRPHLDEIGITCVPTVELDQWESVFEGLSKHLTKDERPGLLEMPGVEADRVAGLYRAAAGFYRRAPWRKLGFETAIKVECDKFESGPWYAVVMGQSGLTFGVSLYEDLNILKKTWSGRITEEENARETVALTLLFGDETEISVLDLEAVRRHGWDVAGPEAYPLVFRKERGMAIRPPLAWELELMEGCLRAVPAFIARHRPDDLSGHRMTVPVASGTLKVTLSWVEDSDD